MNQASKPRLSARHRFASAKSNLKKKITCPWCERGVILGSDDAKGSISVVCPKCGKCFTANMDTGQGMRASPIKIKAAK